jgi:hypothetical protein
MNIESIFGSGTTTVRSVQHSDILLPFVGIAKEIQPGSMNRLSYNDSSPRLTTPVNTYLVDPGLPLPSL